MSRFPGRRRTSADERLDAELRDHVERQVADYVARGMSEPDARRRIRLEAGGLDQVKEACRDVRPGRWLTEFFRDVRLGFRSLRRDRVFAFSVTLILALGIGTTVTMFSVLEAVVLRPLPYVRPAELTTISTHLIAQNRWDGSAMANILDWRAQSKTFASITFYRRTSASRVTFAGIDTPRIAQEGLVGPEFFELLGTPPLVGRTFSQEEFDRGARVVVLSEGLRRERFAGSDAAIGKTLWIDGADHVVIGVMPRTFQLPTRDAQFWRPLSVLPLWPGTKDVRDGDQFEVLGRLKTGMGIEAATAEMAVIGARLREAHAVNRNIDIRITPLLDHVVGSPTRRGIWLGFAAVLCLLVIACTNVGGLLSARAARRRRELAVRSALGAGRARLVRQLVAEAVGLWAVASIAGLLLSYWLVRWLLEYGPRAIPRMDELGLDVTALTAALAGGLVAVMACGTLPALSAANEKTRMLGARDPSSLPQSRLQDLLVAAQIGGAMVLLVAAVLFARSFVHAQHEDPGYPAERLLIAELELPRDRYPDRSAIASYFHQAVERLGRVPGVVAVGGITDFFIRRNADQWVTIEGRPAGKEAGAPRLAVEGVTPGYFHAAGIELLEGRDFNEQDFESGRPGVFIVSDTLARKFWPGESAVGKRLVGGESPPKDGRWNTVIGVVKDMRREGLDVAPILGGFIPAFPRTMDLTIRASSNVDDLLPEVRHEIGSIDASLPIPQIVSAESLLAERLGGRRFETQALSLFAGIALLLSSAGLYALLSYQVILRRREIGIRTALGANRRTIITMIVGKGMRLAALGATVGVLGAALAGKVMQGLLYDTPGIHAPSYTAVGGCVLLIGAVAAWVPALRATRVSPMTVLRDD